MQGQDLATGNLTAPAIFALRSSVAAELRELIDSEFMEEGSLQRAILLVKAGGGIAAAQQLARQEGDMVRFFAAVITCLEIEIELEKVKCSRERNTDA